jgi:tripartite-type tricarboxylate transporter receptor subunit TctC
MMKIRTTLAQLVTVGVLMAFAGSAAAQQAYPNKPIRFITPYPPGGGTDILARLVGQKLTEGWSQQVFVDNRPGGNTIIGSEALIRSPPDGYTIMVVTTAHAIQPSLIPYLPYDTVKDFAAVATVSSSEYFLVLHPSVPANNLQEFIALAKSKPGQLNFSSSGSGGGPHLASEMFSIMAGVKLQHVPYKGGGPALTALVAGQVQALFFTPIATLANIKSGRIKAIAISGETRLSGLPQIPTFTEAGLPGLDVKSWYGILAPVGTPTGIIEKLSTEFARILAMPDFKEKLDSLGMAPFFSTPEQFAALIKADMARYAKIIKAANIKMEN